MVLIAQITSIAIFILMFAAILSERFERHVVTLTCGAMMLIIVVGMMLKDYEGLWNIMAFDEFVNPNFWYQKASLEQSSGVNWATIIFITGMMIIICLAMLERNPFQCFRDFPVNSHSHISRRMFHGISIDHPEKNHNMII